MSSPDSQFGSTRANWLLGTDPRVRLGMRRMLYSSPYYVAGIAIESYASAVVPGCAQLRWLALYTLVGFCAFWWLIRSGRSCGCHDPRLAYPQMLFAVTTAAAAHVSAQAMRGPSIELLCLALVFDMHRVGTRDFLIAVACGAALLCAGVGVVGARAGHGPDLDNDISNLAVTIVAVLAISAVAMQSHGVRKSQMEHNLALEDAVRRMRHLADHDALTGLPNRRRGRAGFDELCAVAEPDAVAIALFDIDHFKGINDRHGHAIGDAVLQRLSEVLQDGRRPNEVVARWGGEEFMALLHCASPDEAMARIDGLRKGVAGHDWSTLSPTLQVTVSAGATLRKQVEPFESAVQRADAALYEAKLLGRNRVQHA